MRTPEPHTRRTIISAVRVPGQRVLLTPYHLIEQAGFICWRRVQCIPLSMLTYVRIRRHYALVWLFLNALCGALILAKLAGVAPLRALPLILLLFASALCTTMYYFRSVYRATFSAPDATIEIAVSLNWGHELVRFCDQVVACQERAAGASGHEQPAVREGPPPLRQRPLLPRATQARRQRMRRTVAAASWR